MKSFIIPLSILSLSAWAAPRERATLTISEPTEIPQTTLTPGRYIIRVVDSLPDRKVLEVLDSSERKVHSTFLAAPNRALKPAGDTQFLYWRPKTGNRALRAWFAGGAAAEIVYEKAKAAALAQSVSAPVPAIDPETDPALTDKSVDMKSLSGRDLKVLQLWALSLDSAEPGAQLQAARYRSAPFPARLPQTASPYFASMIVGFILVCAALLNGCARKASAARDPLELRAAIEGPKIAVRWNPQAPPVREASGATLEIDDCSPRRIQLTQANLAAGERVEEVGSDVADVRLSVVGARRVQQALIAVAPTSEVAQLQRELAFERKRNLRLEKLVEIFRQRRGSSSRGSDRLAE